MSLEVRIRRTLRDFSLETAFTTSDGVLGILGASGCGKSMTLRCIAGVETPDEGRIVLNGRVLFDSAAGINLPPQQRRVGYLFQSYALFPHMTVEENIACALGREEDRKKRAGTIASLVGRFRLEGLEKRYPGQLSGGQQQRVALARILAYEPEALLLDEPFSALDAHLKEKLQLELLELLRGYAGDAVMVTHSRDEAYRLCGRLLIMEHGRPVSEGDTHELFRNPGTLTAARLTGCKNLCPARKIGEDLVEVPGWGVRFKVVPPVPDDLAYVGIRAHDFHPARPGAENAMRVEVCERVESPFEWYILFRNADGGEGEALWWKFSKQLSGEGDAEYLSVAPESILLLRDAFGEHGLNG